MTPRKVLLLGLAVLPLAVVAVLVATRPGPEAQAEALFGRIAHHLTAGRPGDVIEEAEPGYDFVGHFPVLDSLHQQAVTESAEIGADADALLRKSLRSQVARFYGAQQLKGEPVVTWRLHRVGEAEADGSFTAHISFSVEGLRPAPTLTNHRFVLATHGWLRPVARIRSHDPIRL